MRVIEREIASSSDPTDSHPWYELTFDEEAGTVRLTGEADGGLNTPVMNNASAFNDSTPSLDDAPSFDDATPVGDVPPIDNRETPADDSETAFNAATESNADNEPEPDGDRIWAVTMDGELVVYTPTATGVPPLRAHLAWYDAETDTLEVLKFVEP